MKKLFALLLFVGSTTIALAQQKADDIIGTYMTPENKAMVEVTKKDNKYYGKFLWTKTEGKLDMNNPVATEKTKPLKGMEFLKGFSFDNKSTWNNGTIYDPENGKTYSCKITADEKGNLSVRGFIGVSLLGRTSVFIKVK
ncbi:MAG: DUF2147 domain-containing protein [Ferruginibacter sp.]